MLLTACVDAGQEYDNFLSRADRAPPELPDDAGEDSVSLLPVLTGTVGGGAGEPIEFAVRMRQFPQSALLSNVLQRGELTPAHIDDLAATVARILADETRLDHVVVYANGR